MAEEIDVDAVGRAMGETHRVAIAPHFRSLSADDVQEKAAGEVVTVADRAAERFLGPLLRDVVDAPVLGEEAAAVDPSLLDLVGAPGPLWLIDPIDGTANFADGSPVYAVMVAFLRDGQTEAAWILQPHRARLITAVRGAGAAVDGIPVTVPEPSGDQAAWSGVVKDRFVPERHRPALEAGARTLGTRNREPSCAGFEYPTLVDGGHSFLLYWRTRPWDHAPGALVAAEAGGRAIRPDGTDYRVDRPGEGLIVAHRAIVEQVASVLLPS